MFRAAASGRSSKTAAGLRGNLRAALDLLQGLLRLDRGPALLTYYQEFVELHGRRPSAVEAYQDRYNPRSTKGLSSCATVRA